MPADAAATTEHDMKTEFARPLGLTALLLSTLSSAALAQTSKISPTQNTRRRMAGDGAPSGTSPPRIHRANDANQAHTAAATHHHTEKPSAK